MGNDGGAFGQNGPGSERLTRCTREKRNERMYFTNGNKNLETLQLLFAGIDHGTVQYRAAGKCRDPR